jgi:hypothetical protein
MPSPLEILNTIEAPAAEKVSLPPYEMFDYAKAKIRINRIISAWTNFKDAAIRRRKARYIDLDVEKLRDSGEIEPDATFIPQRVIHSNIERDKADAMAFLIGNGDRVVVFDCVDDPTQDCQNLDSSFSRGIKYKGWYRQFAKHYDGASLHGWNTIEVLYDESKPLKVAFEHVGFDRLYFNIEVENIQDSEIVIREYKLSSMRLQEFTQEFGFSEEQVNLLLQVEKDSAKKDQQTFTIFKIYFKYQKCVYVSWFSKEGAVTDWLKPVDKLKCGVRKQTLQQPIETQSIGEGISSMTGGQANPSNVLPMPSPTYVWQDQEVENYPYFLLVAEDDEQECITDHKGRGFLDKPLQEAITAITTAYTNGLSRSTNVFASPKEDNGESSEIKDLEIPLVNGTILSRAIMFYNMPAPDVSTLTALQYLNQQNAQQQGKMDTAVSNRKDARKTSTELQLANQETQKITSINLADYAEFLRETFDFAWQIVRSQALEGNIQFLPISTQVPNTVPVAGAVGMETKVQNDVEFLSKTFNLQPAGVVDVVQKNKQIESFQQDWPVLQTTPIASLILEDYIRVRYPLQADKYIQVLRSGNQGKQIVQSLLAALEGSIQPAELQALKPEEHQQLTTVIQSAQQFLQNPAL